jgi:plasmid maintenance system antidote protein VapI
MAVRKRLTIEASLRRAVARSGESTSALARACGVGRANLNHWTLGRRNLSLRVAERLARHFDLELQPRRGDAG